LWLISAGAGNAAFPLTGTFSDMHCVEQEGDVLGTEITLVGGLDGSAYRYFALVQFAEGAAGVPHLVPVSVDGAKVRFTASYLAGFDVEFSGRVSKKGLAGRWGEPLNESVDLQRRTSFWQAPGDLCYR